MLGGYMKMNKMVNGVIREMTQEEIVELESMRKTPTRKEQIINAIREKYSIDDELAILRQRDSKPEEFKEYFDFVEGVKQNLKETE